MARVHHCTDKLALRVIFIWLALTIVVVPATTGFGIDGSVWTADISPGATVTHKMIVSITREESATDITTKVMGFGESEDFVYYSLDPSRDVSPYSARSFITLDKSKIHLEPGSSEVVIATAKIPSNVGQGSRYAMIHFEGGITGTGPTGIATAIDVPVVFTNRGQGLTIQGSIVDIQVSEVVTGEPVTVTTLFKNTGNYHIANFLNELIIKNSSGEIVYNSSIPSTPDYAIVPTYIVRITSSLVQGLPIGNYSVTSRLISGKRILDERSVMFDIKKAYVPPFQGFSGRIYPQSATVLASPDGRLSINFSQGAVLDEVIVDVQPVLPKKLPSRPPGARFAVSAFSIEGVTGLLVKPVSITIKYSSDDLVAASGDPTKFFLARFDKSDNKWELIPTKVDKGTETLTVTTNRLSTWAIMVSEGVMPTETVVEGTKVPGFNVSIACGALIVFTILNQLRRRRT